ncbi:MAG: rRNA maturation RNase YbeY [Paludibacteraceae bacterium]|nr:rRNA maturation RNase YbeY [Paludibacteraceae bacterium]
MISYITDWSLNSGPKFLRKKINAWIKSTAARYDFKVGDICYIFCSDEKILEVNRQFLQHDYYTDIITFDYTENGKINGDIFISVDTVKSNAEKFNVTFDNELMRVIIHGVLHLTGQNDKTPETEKVMHQKEDIALEELSKM